MDLSATMAALEAAGKEGHRRIYPRHGVRGPLFGVPYADLEKLRKKLGTDHALARALWKTGNHDARIRATMTADPAQMSAKDLDAWMADCRYHVLVVSSGKSDGGTSGKSGAVRSVPGSVSRSSSRG